MKHIFLFSLFLLILSDSIACRCALPLPGFGFHAGEAPILALVNVKSYGAFSDRKKPVALFAKVLYVHKGSISAPFVTIYGNSMNGNDCRCSIPESIDQNKYLLVALYPRDRDYEFGSCGKHYFNLTFWIYGLLLTLISMMAYGFFRKRKKRTLQSK